VHFIWLVKADLRRPLTYGAVLALLLAFRILMWIRNRVTARSTAVRQAIHT
jgi:sulfoxide reductase heme-binding subunit YedZ